MKTTAMLMLLLSTATASELTDSDNDFVITVPTEMRACIALPAFKRTAACDPKRLDALDARPDPSLRTVAFLVDDDQQAVVVMHKLLADRRPMSKEAVERSMNAAIAHAAEKGAHIGGWDKLRVAGVPASRYVLEHGQARSLTYTLQGRDGLTAIEFPSDTAHLAATEELAARLLATARISPPAAPEAPSRGWLIPTVLILALVCAAAALLLHKRRSAQ